jgi:hypothetical protein
VATDVFEVFDGHSGGDAPPDSPPPRFQGAKTTFAVTLAVGVLLAMGIGSYALVKRVSWGSDDVSLCTTQQRAAQAALSGWLRERAATATDSSAVIVTGTGCATATKGQPVGAMTHLVDRRDLNSVVATLRELGCELKVSKAGRGQCRVSVDDVTVRVLIEPSPTKDPDGDYIWRATIDKPTSAG